MNISRIKKKELLRFLVGGGSAVVVDFTLYRVLMVVGLDRTSSKAFSFICGSIVGFIINKLWTFESFSFSKKEIFRYIVLYTCTATINTIVNKSVLMIVPVELAGFLCATGVSTILNFLGQKYFVFQK